jgi:hypothetical protein
VFLKTAISVGPVLPILYLTDQVWAGAVLGRFVRALSWVQGTLFILGDSWGLMKLVIVGTANVKHDNRRRICTCL